MFAGTAALAIERHQAGQARLAAEAKEQAARNDLAFLLKASTALTSDLDYTQTLRRLAASCVPDLAPLCAVDIADAYRIRRVAAAAPSSGQEDLLAAHIPVYDAEDDAVTRVLASGRTEVARRTPTGPGPWQDLGITGYLCVPLIDRSRTFGTLTLLTTGELTFDGHTVALAEELARRAAPAAINARQYSQRTALARDLQAGLLLPGVPVLPAAEAAVYYHPAGEGLQVGGAFYDIFPLPGGRWAFMLGDVCGRGAIAAATTALVRHTARAVAPLLPGPAAVVQAVNKALIDRPDSHGTGFVTMIYGHLAPADDGGLDITLVRAGHLPPLHIDHRHAVCSVDIPGSFLGVTAEPQTPVCHLRLGPAESLLLYTDGITEARNSEHEQFGEERLARVLSQDLGAVPSAQQVIDVVTSAVRAFDGSAGTDTGDDQAILVLIGRQKEQSSAG
jgi:serine phosphatase RsbU (regulator of sigma subunit)